jgi:peptidoglycan/LPS O-acetylase OafA/YrhL
MAIPAALLARPLRPGNFRPRNRRYARRVYKVAAALSALVLVAWAILIAAWPSDDAQVGIGYFFLTVYAVVALMLIWAIAGVISHFARRKAKSS